MNYKYTAISRTNLDALFCTMFRLPFSSLSLSVFEPFLFYSLFFDVRSYSPLFWLSVTWLLAWLHLFTYFLLRFFLDITYVVHIQFYIFGPWKTPGMPVGQCLGTSNPKTQSQSTIKKNNNNRKRNFYSTTSLRSEYAGFPPLAGVRPCLPLVEGRCSLWPIDSG